jgi:hypothetical protein
VFKTRVRPWIQFQYGFFTLLFLIGILHTEILAFQYVSNPGSGLGFEHFCATSKRYIKSFWGAQSSKTWTTLLPFHRWRSSITSNNGKNH